MDSNIRKKIIVVGQAEVTSTVGGAITVFINFCNMLTKNDYDVYGVCYNSILGQPKNLFENVKFSNLYEEYNKIDYSKAMNRKMEEVQPDLIVFFFDFLCRDAKLSDKFNDIPRILMFHSRPDFYFSNNPSRENKLKKYYINTTSQILFDSYQQLLPDFIKKNNVITIPNGIELQNEIIDTSIEHKKIIYLSRIDCWKGLELLINSFNLIANKYKDWSVDIYGQFQPPEYKDNLVKLVETKGLSNQIYFKGITSNPVQTMLNYDFCIFPSYFEGFPMGLIESQSVGLPCVGLKGCSGVNELIIDEKNGFLADETYEDIASKIEKLILDKNLRTEFSKNTIIEVQKYDKEKINKKWLDVINLILNGKNICSDYTKVAQNKYTLFSIEKILKMSSNEKPKMKWYHYIFSVKNSMQSGVKRKTIYILGIKITLKR